MKIVKSKMQKEIILLNMNLLVFCVAPLSVYPSQSHCSILTTPKMDIPQKNTPKNVEDLSEAKRASK